MVHLNEPQTLGLESVGKGRTGGQGANIGSVVEGHNPTTEVGDIKMVADLEMADIVMAKEQDEEMEPSVM